MSAPAATSSSAGWCRCPVPEEDGFFVAQGFPGGDEVVTQGAAALFAAEQSARRRRPTEHAGPDRPLVAGPAAPGRWPRVSCSWRRRSGRRGRSGSSCCPSSRRPRPWSRPRRRAWSPNRSSSWSPADRERADRRAGRRARPLRVPLQGLSIVTVQLRRRRRSRPRAPGGGRAARRPGAALPPGVGAPRIAPLTAAGDVLQIGFTSAKLDAMAPARPGAVDGAAAPAGAAGVARVAVYGGQTRRIEVRARPGDLSDSDLGFLDILNAVRRATSVAGAGFIDTPGQRVLIEPHGQALTTDDVGAGQIQTPGSAPVRIDDVADVVEAPAPAFGDALIDGKPGVLVEVGAAVRRQHARRPRARRAGRSACCKPALAAQGVSVRDDLDRPASLHHRRRCGASRSTSPSASLLIAAGAGAVPARSRAVLISLVSIPLSLLAAVAAEGVLGWTLNSMTLGGLAVALGRGDRRRGDRRRERAEPLARGGLRPCARACRLRPRRPCLARQAVLAASLEVRGPVVYATLALVAAARAAAAAEGPQGALLAPLAGAIILVCAGLAGGRGRGDAGAVLAVPAARRPTASRGRWTACATRTAAWLDGFRRAPAPGLVLAGVVAWSRSPRCFLFRLRAAADRPRRAAVRGDRGAALDLARGDARLRACASARDLKALPGVASVGQRIGRDPTGDDSWGLEPQRVRHRAGARPSSPRQAGIAADACEAAWSCYPGLHPAVTFALRRRPGPPPAAAPAVRSVSSARTWTRWTPAAAERRRPLAACPARAAFSARGAGGAPTVRIDLNFQRLALYGLSAADVLDTVQAAFAGERVAQIYSGGRVVDLAVSAQASLRRDPEGVGDLLLRSTSGISVPLKAVANVYLTDGRGHDRPRQRPAPPGDHRRRPDSRASPRRRARRSPRQACRRACSSRFRTRQAADGPARRWSTTRWRCSRILVLLAIAFDARTGALMLACAVLVRRRGGRGGADGRGAVDRGDRGPHRPVRPLDAQRHPAVRPAGRPGPARGRPGAGRLSVRRPASG